MIQWTGIVPTLQAKSALAEWLALVYVAPTAEGKLKLYKNNFTPGIGTLISDLADADFSGYAPIDLPAADLPAVKLDPSGNAYAVDLTVREFLRTGAANTGFVYGYYITNDAGTTLFAAKRFADPVDVGTPLDVYIDIELGYRLSPSGFVTGSDDTVSVPM